MTLNADGSMSLLTEGGTQAVTTVVHLNTHHPVEHTRVIALVAIALVAATIEPHSFAPSDCADACRQCALKITTGARHLITRNSNKARLRRPSVQ
jgi:hypothetical protein